MIERRWLILLLFTFVLTGEAKVNYIICNANSVQVKEALVSSTHQLHTYKVTVSTKCPCGVRFVTLNCPFFPSNLVDIHLLRVFTNPSSIPSSTYGSNNKCSINNMASILPGRPFTFNYSYPHFLPLSLNFSAYQTPCI